MMLFFLAFARFSCGRTIYRSAVPRDSTLPAPASMNIVLFEDQRVEQLFPITLTRPAYAICCGSLRLVDLVKHLDAPASGVARHYLSDFQQDYFDHSPRNASGPTLWLNARLVPEAQLLDLLKPRLASAEPFVARIGDVVGAALTPPASSIKVEQATPQDIVQSLENSQLPSVDIPLRLIDYPHTLVREHVEVSASNLEFRLATGQMTEIAAGVFSASGSLPSVPVAFDSSNGPIVLEQGVSLGAFSVLQGPIYLDRDVQVSPHALLKGPLSVGHTSKIGGEVSRSIFEPYSNKVHFGYLGSSYVGSWVNLGGGTTNSNLKNTYGSIRVDYRGEKIDTNMQFFGCVIGDFTKTAINTSIYTGKMLGVCSNVYGTVTSNVPSFSNYARSFGEITEHPAEVMIATQRRVFERRGIRQQPRHTQLLQTLYAMESAGRKLGNHPPSL